MGKYSNINELLKFKNELKAFKNREADIIKSIANELAARLLAKVKKRTPVGEYIEVATPVVEDINDYYEIDVEGHTKHTTYLVGENVIVLDDIGDAHPYEMYRDPKKNGGEDTLYIRDGYICGFNAPISFVANNSVTTSASNADLENGANWEVVNDGRTAVSTKAIAIARLISKSLN